MGRPNYTNRKIEGLKLGQAVAKDLVRLFLAELMGKSQTLTSLKIKRIPPDVHAKAALRGPVVELDVTGKALQNDGFHEVATALVKSIEYRGEQGRVVKLEELCLRDNKLDSKCLIDLGLVIRRAARDLEDLDLSYNSIRIVTNEDTAAFEYFLRSFAECYKIRRVDFSGNELGIRAFEIFAKVYGSEDPLYLSITDDGQPDPSAREGGYNNTARIDEGLQRKFNSLQNAPDHEAMDPYATTRGLRSVPYLIFADTSMTEACALHLSYIVPHHPTPTQLMQSVPPAKAGPPAQRLSAYNLESRCQGVIYFPNADLGNAGLKVLELAELVRRKSLEELDSEIPEAGQEQTGHTITDLAVELDRARSRIQGNTLRGFGASSDELWHTALKVLCLGRIICQSKIKRPPIVQADGQQHQTRSSAAPNATGLAIHPSPKPTPLAFRSPNQPLTLRLRQEYRNGKLVLTPIAPTLPSPPSPQSPPPIATPITNPELSPTTSPPQESSPTTSKDPYRTQLPGGFTEDIWRQIAAYVVGADGIMTAEQQLSMLRWAMDRKTLAQEKESLGKPKSAQIWKVLESTRCLAYETKA